MAQDGPSRERRLLCRNPAFSRWEKNNTWKRAAFPPGSSGSYSHSEVVSLADADALVLAISGRGVGGAYTLTASVT
jgi:hypothetical protein